jgi:cytochrome P450
MSATPFAPAPPGSGLVPVPGDRGLPLIGRTVSALRNPAAMANARYERYGPVSWTSMFGTRVVQLLGPDATGAVLVNRDKAFSNGEGWGHFIEKFFHRGLMLLDFGEHHQHRRIMQQAFTRDRLLAYLDQLHPAAERGLATWQPAERFQLYPALKQLTLDLAMAVFVGTPLDPAQAATNARVNKAFVDTVRAGTAYVRAPIPGGRWAAGLRGRKVLERFFAGYIPAKRRGDGDDLFSALLQARTEDGHQFTDDDVVNHMIFLLMAAHDTSTITMTTMAYYLGRYPEWQERVRAESLALDTDTPTYDQLESLTSMDLVMKESLRLIAPVPSMPRKTVRDTEVLGHAIPAGTLVGTSPQFTHHLAAYWPAPDRFDPERFSAQRREDKVHQYAWVPFGGGVHKCIGLHFGGMEVKAVMHRFIRHYGWSVAPDYVLPVDWKSLPRPTDGLPVRLTRAAAG